MELSQEVATEQQERLKLLPYYPDSAVATREILKTFKEICIDGHKYERKPVTPDEQCEMLVDLVLRREKRWAGIASLREAHRDLFPVYPDFE